MVPEEFVMHSGRVAGATRVAMKGIPVAMIKREGRCFYGLLEGVSEMVEEGKGECETQLGRGTIWGM